MGLLKIKKIKLIQRSLFQNNQADRSLMLSMKQIIKHQLTYQAKTTAAFLILKTIIWLHQQIETSFSLSSISPKEVGSAAVAKTTISSAESNATDATNKRPSLITKANPFTSFEKNSILFMTTFLLISKTTSSSMVSSDLTQSEKATGYATNART